MADIGERSKIYTGNEVIAIPATVGTTTTITGEILYPFEASGWGDLRVVYKTGDASKATATLTLKTYVSFDEGTTWEQAHLDTVSASATTIFTYAVPFAARIRIDLVTTGSGALTAGHGVVVQAEFQENDPEAKRVIGSYAVGDSIKQVGDSTVTVMYGDSLTINSPNKLTVWATAADLSDITDTFTWKVQSSLDATNWFDSGTTISAPPASGSGPAEIAAEEITSGLSKHMRMSVSGDTPSALGSAHGIIWHFLAQE